MSEPVLEVRGLSVDYGYGDDAVHAVVDCDLTLRRGQVLGLAGESGSGKTTTAMAAIRLLRSPGVMTAMALALEPQVMILDEPTTALDVVTQREILEELMGLRDRLGFAALFITHDLSLLVELADEIAVMYAGRLVERAPAASLFRAPRLPYTHGLLNCFPPMHGKRVPMEGIPGSPPDLRDLPSGCAFHPRCRWAMDRCTREVPQLAPVDGSGREVACWLHRYGAQVPPDLARPEPAQRPALMRVSEQ